MRALIHRPGARFNRGRISSARQAYQMLAAMAGVYGVFIAGVRESYVTPTLPTDVATWSAVGLTGAPLAGIDDPLGGTGAYRVIEDTSAGNHGVHVNPITNATIAVGRSSSIDLYLRSSNRRAFLQLYNSGAGISDYCTIDLTDGSVGGSIAGVTPTVTASASGYWKIHLDFDDSAVYFVIDLNNGASSYTGDGSSYVDVFIPSTSAYVQAGSTSQLVFPNYGSWDAYDLAVAAPADLTNAAWVGTGASGTDATTITASAGSSGHYLRQNIADCVAGARTHVKIEFSAGSYDYLYTGDGSGAGVCSVQVSTQTFTNLGANISGQSITDLGGGSYRVEYDISAINNSYIYVGLSSASGVATWTAAGGETIHATNIVVSQSRKVKIQTIDQSTFANMPLRDFLSTGARAMLFSAAAGAYMQGTLLASIPAPWGVAAVCKYVSSGSTQQWFGSGSVGIYVDGTTDVMVSGSAISGAIADGEHIFTVEDDGAGTRRSWVDDPTTMSGSAAVASAAIASGSVTLGSNVAHGSCWNDRIQAICIYDPSVADRVKIFSLLNRIAKRPI